MDLAVLVVGKVDDNIWREVTARLLWRAEGLLDVLIDAEGVDTGQPRHPSGFVIDDRRCSSWPSPIR